MLKIAEIAILQLVAFIGICSQRKLAYVSIVGAIIFCLTLRLSGFQTDLIVYADTMTREISGFYYYREPYFWMLSQVLFDWFRDERAVFFVFDSVFCISLWIALSRVGMTGFYFIFLTSFPIYLGLENVYRQVLGIPFALLFLASVRDNKTGSALLWLTLSVLAHNIFAILGPLLFYWSLAQRKLIGFWFVVTLQMSIFLVLVAAGADVDMLAKSQDIESGSDLRLLYFVLLTASLLVPRLLLGKVDRYSAIVYAYCWTTLVMSIYFLGSFHVERIGMVFLVALTFVYILGKELKSLSHRLQLQFAYYTMLNVPVFVFPSTRHFLIG